MSDEFDFRRAFNEAHPLQDVIRRDEVELVISGSLFHSSKGAHQERHTADKSNLAIKETEVTQGIDCSGCNVRNTADISDMNAAFRVIDIIRDEDGVAIDRKNERTMTSAGPGYAIGNNRK